MRERLRGLVASALHHLADDALACGQIEDALVHARRLTQMNPLDELAQRRLMELLWRSGQRSAALQQYEEASRQLTLELGVAPDANTVALYERVRDAPFLPPRQLPARTGELIGREKELARLDAWLRDPQARLISILGPGGMGKTRLLQEVARRAAAQPGRYMDGVFDIPREAYNHLQHAATLARDKGFWLDIANAGIGLAHTLDLLGKVHEAAEHADKAYNLAVKHHNRRLIALAARAQGRAVECAGDYEAARAAFRHSLSLP